MTQKKKKSPSCSCHVKLEEEYQNTLSKEIRDYIRNGDVIILRRVLFKMFVNQPVPSCLQREKARAVLCMLGSDSDISSTIRL
jgi:hypothetical protein